jgi:hypothetical protein
MLEVGVEVRAYKCRRMCFLCVAAGESRSDDGTHHMPMLGELWSY